MKNKTQRKLRRGFTLMELLVVIIILGILFALVVPKLVAHTGEAKVAKAKADIQEMSSLLQNYRLDNDQYPTTEEGLDALVNKPADASNWKGPYTMKAIPTDPWGNDYQYQCPGPNGEDFLITSYGSDGQPGGDGDAADITSDDN